MMDVKFLYADKPGEPIFMEPHPEGFPLPIVGDYLSGIERPQGGFYVYKVTARRFHFDWNEVWIFVREGSDEKKRNEVSDRLADSVEQAIHFASVVKLDPDATAMIERWERDLADYRKIHPFGMAQLDHLLPEMKKAIEGWNPADK